MTEKCAPSKNYKDGSCFSLESLKLIAQNYNKRYGKKIEITDDKKNMVEQLESKLKDKCSSQTCWLRQEFIKELDNDDINNTFRPVGPKNRYEWLSTSNIDDVVGQYQDKYDDFLFLGAVPLDFEDLDIFGINNLDFNDIEKKGKHKIGMVINLDEHYKGGSHWVSLFSDLSDGKIYFSDSYGTKPEKRIIDFIKRIENYLVNNRKISKPDVRYNRTQHQRGNSECGVYSINFILRLLKGKTFDHITGKRITDEKVNECRNVYFLKKKTN
jgi:hypothetical protein